MPLSGNAQPFNRQPYGKVKHKESHVMPTKYGMGDNYGTGIRAKLGRMRSDSVGMVAITPKKLKNPPTSVA
jgi:hypothetical protein